MTKELRITLQIDRQNIALPQLFIGYKSAAALIVFGVPVDADGATLLIKSVDGLNTWTVTGAKVMPGAWRFFAHSGHFVTVGVTSYEVAYTVPESGQSESPTYFGGGGVLQIISSALTGGTLTPTSLNRDQYLYDPATGLWHKVIAVSIDGEETVEVSDEGVSL